MQTLIAYFISGFRVLESSSFLLYFNFCSNDLLRSSQFYSVFYLWRCFVAVREQLKELTKQYDKSENDLKALQSVGQVRADIRGVW